MACARKKFLLMIKGARVPIHLCLCRYVKTLSTLSHLIFCLRFFSSFRSLYSVLQTWGLVFSPILTLSKLKCLEIRIGTFLLLPFYQQWRYIDIGIYMTSSYRLRLEIFDENDHMIYLYGTPYDISSNIFFSDQTQNRYIFQSIFLWFSLWLNSLIVKSSFGLLI